MAMGFRSRATLTKWLMSLVTNTLLAAEMKIVPPKSYTKTIKSVPIATSIGPKTVCAAVIFYWYPRLLPIP